MDTHRIGAKIFAKPPLGIDATDAIPVFHRWIQQGALEGLLIDVADYSHVPAGPGVFLVGHEANQGLDWAGHRPGYAYVRKSPLDGTAAERVGAVVRHALVGARKLAGEDELGGRVDFDPNEIEIFFNDRAAAPNTDSEREQARAALGEVADRIFGPGKWSLEFDEDPRSRLTATIRGTGGVTLVDLENFFAPVPAA